MNLSRAPWWLAALALAALLGCTEPREKYDCQQLLGERRYATVLDSCDNPTDRASAYMGLAGFEMTKLVNLTSTGDIVGLLGLTPANIAEKRGYLEQAVQAVRNPVSGTDAGALIVASLLAMAVATEDFMDNTTCTDDLPLNGVFSACEVLAATGLATLAPTEPTIAVNADTYLSLVAGGSSYTLICTDALLPTTLLCDDDNIPGTRLAYIDVDGSGKIDTSAPVTDGAASISGLSGASPVSLAVQLAAFALPFTLDPVKTQAMEEFLNQGGTQFPIGMFEFLNLLDRANAVIAVETGSTGTSSALQDNLDFWRNKLDNGADCLSTQPSPAPEAAELMNLMYSIYAAAAGTTANPAAGVTDFSGYNVVPSLTVTIPGFTLPGNLDPTLFIFNPTPIGFKFLYPKTAGLTAFDVSQATPLIKDPNPSGTQSAYSAFAAEFENIPKLAPNAATAGDGRVTFLELFCSAS